MSLGLYLGFWGEFMFLCVRVLAASDGWLAGHVGKGFTACRYLGMHGRFSHLAWVSRIHPPPAWRESNPPSFPGAFETAL